MGETPGQGTASAQVLLPLPLNRKVGLTVSLALDVAKRRTNNMHCHIMTIAKHGCSHTFLRGWTTDPDVVMCMTATTALPDMLY